MASTLPILLLSAISLMTIHAAAGINIPFVLAEAVLGGTTAVAVFKVSRHSVTLGTKVT